MFFTAELLEKRDGGLGLLWLAATLGSKSTLKRLPRRDVMTADISQLCNSIIQPTVPLALRLTSNLMVGVARVYKVKQEIFMTDVNSCFNSLKKVVHDIQTTTDAQIQMAQPTLKSTALTLDVANPPFELAGLDIFVADWDEYLNIADGRDVFDDVDDDFNPNPRKQVPRNKPPSTTEYPRTDKHTLREDLDHLLSTSLDLSFNGSFNAGLDHSSSQAGGGMVFDDFFGPPDNLDIGPVGDELARELGEGWGASPVKDMNVIAGDPAFDFDLCDNDHLDADILRPHTPFPTAIDHGTVTPPSQKRKITEVDGGDNEPYLPSEPPAPFARQASSQGDSQAASVTGSGILRPLQDNFTALKKHKKTRLLLDARTELSDEELKAARAEYLRGQHTLKEELCYKQAEKNGMKLVEDIIWGPPKGIQAPSLVHFWQENFKVQVEARTGALSIHPLDACPPKRRKTGHPSPGQVGFAMAEQFDIGMPDFREDFNFVPLQVEDHFDHGRLRSSEEPGQGRNASRPPSGLGFDFASQGHVASQRSSLFPWDNAGASSSVAGVGFAPFGSDQPSIERPEVALRGSSLSRREDSLFASHIGAFSPAIVGRSSQLIGDDYAFEGEHEASGPDTHIDNDPSVDAEVGEAVRPCINDDSQRSDINLVALERNSLNFLEYTRMQYQTLSGGATELTFEDIVPKMSSTRHVATAAFYHCLVLSTKKLLSVKQDAPYGRITIAIV